jgi:hypothetical protein
MALAILTESFCDIPEFLHENAGRVTGHMPDHSLPHLSEFTIHNNLSNILNDNFCR